MNNTEVVKADSSQLDHLPWVTCIGTKIVELTPMCVSDAEVLLGRVICKDNADTQGPGYLVRYEDGYISWSPAKVAEKAYISYFNMNVCHAIEALKNGYKVSCHRWYNPKRYIYYVQGTEVPRSMLKNEARTHNSSDEAVNIYGHFDIHTPTGIIVGWTPSSMDLVSDDFFIVTEDTI